MELPSHIYDANSQLPWDWDEISFNKETQTLLFVTGPPRKLRCADIGKIHDSFLKIPECFKVSIKEEFDPHRESPRQLVIVCEAFPQPAEDKCVELGIKLCEAEIDNCRSFETDTCRVYYFIYERGYKPVSPLGDRNRKH